MSVAVVVPPLVATAALPSAVPPSVKVTVPVGLPLPPAPGVTVAVNVTDWPYADGFGSTPRLVVVASMRLNAIEPAVA